MKTFKDISIKLNTLADEVAENRISNKKVADSLREISKDLSDASNMLAKLTESVKDDIKRSFCK